MRFSLAILTAVTFVLSSGQADACCLTDWLFGRTTSPYAVGYAPVASGPQVVGVPPMTVARPMMSAPVMSSGAYQAQRPAYVNNPSVYTGMPVTGNVQATYQYQVAPAPVTVAPVTVQRPVFSNPLGFRGQTPVTTYRPQMQTSIPGQPLTITTPSATPATGIPATPVAPLFQPVQPRPVGPIRGFFSRLFGTGYRTSYYRAPITYYRPVTTVDPVTGTTVTVQRPCTSVVQQLQRTPIATVQSMQPGYGYGTPAANCPTPTYGYNQGVAAPSNYGIGQVGAVGSMGQGATQIPSSMPPSSYGTYGGYNGAPLQGSPPATNGNGDYAPMQQPRLESQSPASNGNGSSNGNGNGNGSSQGTSGSEQSPSNYWQLQNAEDSTAMIRRTPSSQSQSNFPPSNDYTTSNYKSSNYGTTTDRRALRGQVEPIAAPEDYVSPFRSRSAPPATAQPQRDSFQAPPLPQRSPSEPTELTAVSTRRPVSTALRSTAPASRPGPVQRVQQRDSTWYPVK